MTQTIIYPNCGCSLTGPAPMPITCPTHGTAPPAEPQKTAAPDKPKAKASIHLAILLDESGSMIASRKETIQGLNGYLKGLRGDPNADYYVTLNKFDALDAADSDCCRTLFTNRPLDKVPEISEKDYTPRGWTPWYDALGKTISQLDERGDSNPVLVVSISDGYENASKKFDRASIQKLIREREYSGNWTFVYLGANIDAIAATAGTSIPGSSTMSFNQFDTYKVVSRDLQAATMGYSQLRSEMSTSASYTEQGGHFFSAPITGVPPSSSHTPSTTPGRSNGGYARAIKLSPEERSSIAKKAAASRWKTVDKKPQR